MPEYQKSQLDTLSKFLQHYDYSYWHYKLKTLHMVLEDEKFLEDISKEFTKGGDVEQIRNRLISEVLFTNLHMIECLFLLIGAFTHNLTNPWAWINEKGSHPSKIATHFKKGKLKKLYKNLGHIGVKTLEDYIMYLFYNVPTTPELDKKIKTLIEPTIYALEEIRFEYFDKIDLYNAYKHGAITMPVNMRVTKRDSSDKEDTIVEPFPALMYVPKEGRKSRLGIGDLNFESFFDPVPDFMPLNYRREKKIGGVILSLIRNLINVRKALFIERASKVSVILIPSIEELKEIFARPVLYIEKISFDEYKNRLERGEL